MTRLIDVTRAFDGVAAETSQSETSLQEAIKTLGSVRLIDAALRRRGHAARSSASSGAWRMGSRGICWSRARRAASSTEVSMSHYRVAGLSRFLKLGECVSVDVGDRVQIGEVVRIDDASVTLKPFDARCDAAIGARAYRAENLSLSPHTPWKGRVIDALGRPIDGERRARPGRPVMPLDAESASGALRRARVHAPIKTRHSRRRFLLPALRRAENRRLRRIGRRQVLASGDAGPGAADSTPS